jgi:hypothetical protein
MSRDSERPQSERSQDPKALRALAHPLRWKLLDLLGAEVTATATRCAEALGQSVASCSYHLNMLAKYGYIEEAPSGPGREKPWRLTTPNQGWTTSDPDTETALAAEAVTEVFLDHELARLKENVRRQDREPTGWREATSFGGSTTFLTRDELREVSEEIERVMLRYSDRLEDPARRPSDGREVRIFFATSIAAPRPSGG